MSVDLNVDTVDEAIAAAVLKLRSVGEVLQTQGEEGTGLVER